MDAQTSQRVGKIMTIIRHENPEIVKSIIKLIESGEVFENFPQEIKSIIIQKEKDWGRGKNK